MGSILTICLANYLVKQKGPFMRNLLTMVGHTKGVSLIGILRNMQAFNILQT